MFMNDMVHSTGLNSDNAMCDASAKELFNI